MEYLDIAGRIIAATLVVSAMFWLLRGSAVNRGSQKTSRLEGGDT